MILMEKSRMEDGDKPFSSLSNFSVRKMFFSAYMKTTVGKRVRVPSKP
jgi:hypothetical protein